MKSPRLAVLLSLVTGIAVAQSVAPVAAPGAATSEDALIVLNPFVVSTEATNGYYASETLSGTQLKSQVRDLANPITVLTEEFMRDIGAVNYEEALEFLPSTQAFKGDSADPESVTARTGTPFTVRGFRSSSLTNNFFISRIKVDTFNTETVTQSRGPNSLLFGLGSVGGGLEATNKTGRFNADSYNLEVRIDSEGSQRASVDINRIIIPKKVALRFAALSTDQRTARDFQYMRRNSAYLSLNLQPFKGATINLNAETGRIDELTPRPYLTYDSVSAWLNDSRTPLQKANTIDQALVSSGSAAARTAARNLITGVSQGFPTTNYLVYVMNAPQLGVQNWYYKSKGSEAFVNGLNQSQTSMSESTRVPGVDFPLDTVVSGPSDYFDTTYDKFSASWQQQILDKTFIEVAGAYEKSENEDWQPIQRGDYEVFIDNNYYLPNQFAANNPDRTKPLNPYFGTPYLESNATLQNRRTKLSQYRATLTRQFDLSRLEPIKGLDLGKLTAVAFHYYRYVDSYFQQPEEMTTTSVLASGVLSDTQNQIRRRYYLLPGQPGSFPAFPPSQARITQTGNPATPGSVIPTVNSAFLHRLNPIYAPETTRSYAAIGQWELFSRRLVLTGGVRRDDFSSKNFVFAQDPVTRLFRGEGQGAFAPETSSSVTNTNYGAVVRVTKWLDAFANSATNTVSAGGTNYDIFNRTLPNQEGLGYDLGVRGFFLNDRVILKVNYFNNELSNRIANPLRDGAIGVEMARQNGYVERFLEGMVLNGLGSRVAGARRFADYPGNGLWTDVESDLTEGYEVEATLNPTKQLRVLLNVSYNQSELNGTYTFTRPWYEQYVKPIRDDAAIRSLVANPAFNATRTIGDYITGIERRLNYHEAQVGGARLRGTNWLVNLVSSYAFDHGPLKGTRIGGSARWREAPVIGYPERAGTFDVANPFIGEDSLVTDAFASYAWRQRVSDRTLNWTVSLRVRNLLNDDDPSAASAVDNGSGRAHILQRIYQAPRTYELSAGLRF
jgi:hypothetical protein